MVYHNSQVQTLLKPDISYQMVQHTLIGLSFHICHHPTRKNSKMRPTGCANPLVMFTGLYNYVIQDSTGQHIPISIKPSHYIAEDILLALYIALLTCLLLYMLAITSQYDKLIMCSNKLQFSSKILYSVTTSVHGPRPHSKFASLMHCLHRACRHFMRHPVSIFT
jgi:hypothetical protein